MTSARRPWLAALLSLLCSPGIGQLYNGRVFRAALFLIGLPLAACLLLWSMTVLLLPPLNVLLPLLVLVGMQLASGVDAFLDARRLRDAPRPWYARWYACLALGLLNTSLVIPSARSLVRTSLVRAFNVASGSSMQPTLLGGDHVLVDLRGFGARAPGMGFTLFAPKAARRGDLVAFLRPMDRRRVQLNRVVGLPGESVEMRSAKVSIDHEPLSEPYLQPLSPALPGRWRDWGPRDKVFLLGDNRDNSYDSRHFGFVALADVLGVARVVYFSWNATEKRVRWGRIGLRLR